MLAKLSPKREIYVWLIVQFIMANMNEKLHSWTLKFRKVVRQKISDEVVDLTIALSAVHVWMRQWKNYWNWSTSEMGNCNFNK